MRYLELLPHRLRPAKNIGGLWSNITEYFGAPAYDLNSRFDEQTLRYPIKLEHFVTEVPAYFLPLNPDGVPIKEYGIQGVQYVPSRIAGYALACWNLSIDDPIHPTYSRHFLACAN